MPPENSKLISQHGPEIVPALIPKDFYELKDKVGLVSGYAKFVHIDVCDGIFVGNTSWPREDDKIFVQILDGDIGLPEWEDLDYEIHLMTAHPENNVVEWIEAGAYRITIQIESFFPNFGKNQHDFDPAGLARFTAMMENLKTDKKYNPDNEDDFFQLGVSVTLDTPLEMIKKLIPQFHYVQVMSIPHIGHQGVKFDDRSYERVRELRDFISTLPNHKDISVDGGVNMENAVKLVEAGADRLVEGSVIFGNDVPGAVIESMHALFD